jgi:hypothetical protein
VLDIWKRRRRGVNCEVIGSRLVVWMGVEEMEWNGFRAILIKGWLRCIVVVID